METWKGSGAAEINSRWGSHDRGSEVQMLHYKHSVGYGHNTSHQFVLDVQWKISSSLPYQELPTWMKPLLTHRVCRQQSVPLIRSASGVHAALYGDETFPPLLASGAGVKKSSSILMTCFFFLILLFLWHVTGSMNMQHKPGCGWSKAASAKCHLNTSKWQNGSTCSGWLHDKIGAKGANMEVMNHALGDDSAGIHCVAHIFTRAGDGRTRMKDGGKIRFCYTFSPPHKW